MYLTKKESVYFSRSIDQALEFWRYGWAPIKAVEQLVPNNYPPHQDGLT